jgi:hypothetical protein
MSDKVYMKYLMLEIKLIFFAWMKLTNIQKINLDLKIESIKVPIF